MVQAAGLNLRMRMLAIIFIIVVIVVIVATRVQPHILQRVSSWGVAYHLAVGALVPLLVSGVAHEVVAACLDGCVCVVYVLSADDVVADAITVEIGGNEGGEGESEEGGGELHVGEEDGRICFRLRSEEFEMYRTTWYIQRV